MNTATNDSFENIGTVDIIIRMLTALAMLGLVLSLDLGPALNIALVLLSVPTMLFALMRWDPIYKLLGFDSKKDKLIA